MSNNSHALPTLAEVTAAPPGFYSTARLTCDSRERAGPPLVLKTWRELSVAFELGAQGGSRPSLQTHRAAYCAKRSCGKSEESGESGEEQRTGAGSAALS